jgi:hypothetical protein
VQMKIKKKIYQNPFWVLKKVSEINLILINHYCLYHEK